jgi:hypothetical protein
MKKGKNEKLIFVCFFDSFKKICKSVLVVDVLVINGLFIPYFIYLPIKQELVQILKFDKGVLVFADHLPD